MPIYKEIMKIMKGKMLAIEDQVKLKPDQVIFNQTQQTFVLMKMSFVFVFRRRFQDVFIKRNIFA